MKDSIEISPYGNMLVYKKGYTSDFVKKAIIENGLDGLRIFDHLDKLESLDFLKGYSFLKKLHIHCMHDQDYNFLAKLHNLEDLSIGGSVKNINEINLRNQKNLKILGINWRKNIIGLENCTKLLSLTATEFKEKDLQKTAMLTSLINLSIKTASIETLEGIGNLSNLQNLHVANCKRLQSIKAINHLRRLRELYLDKCPNIKDYEEVSDLPNLEALSLIDCGNVQSLNFIEQYPSLSKLSLLGNTVICDGNLIPAKRIKFLQHKHYSHYNIKLENPSYNRNIKTNLEKIKNLFK